MYAKGIGVPQDYVQAHMWTNIAASKDLNQAKAQRDLLVKGMNPQQVQQAQAFAAERVRNHRQ